MQGQRAKNETYIKTVSMHKKTEDSLSLSIKDVFSKCDISLLHM